MRFYDEANDLAHKPAISLFLASNLVDKRSGYEIEYCTIFTE